MGKLAQHYYTPRQPGAFGGVAGLARVTKLKPTVVKEWLSHQDTYTLHKPIRRSFVRRRIIVGGIDHQWQADLIDVQRLKQHNDGYAYLLTCIDVFSKFAWVEPLKNKTGPTMVEAFRRIFSTGRKPRKLQTDKGTEFLNRTFQKFLKEAHVDFFVTENEDIKAAVVERFNRSLKEKLWRYFTRKNTLRYKDVLTPFVQAYNRSYHRSIKRAPVEVDADNQEDVWQTLYGDQQQQQRVTKTMTPGDRVRISKARSNFKKGYLPAWTEELFTISRIYDSEPTTYVLKDDHGDELRGTFYSQELQKVGAKDTYRIEEILKQRVGAGGRKEYLVKWYGYDASFNSWIPQSSLTRY